MALTAKKVYAILKRQISDMEAKIKTPIIYRGTVATADLLPLNPDIGDMYNIESKSVYGEAGMNVAWNGVVWDTMGAPIDMSLYIKSSELADWVKQQNKPTYTAEEVGALPADTKIPSKTSDLQNDSGFLTKIPDNYLSGTDKTLSVSGKAADAKATGDKITELSADISNKLNKNQGSENSGKIAGINESGDIVPMFPVGVEYNSETNCLEFGSDQKMELNQGIGLDSTLTKTGFAADAGAVGEITNSLKEDLGEKGTALTDIQKKMSDSNSNDGFLLCDLNGNIVGHIASFEVWNNEPYNKKYGWGGHPYGNGKLPPYSKIAGVFEADLLSVCGGKGRWNKDDTGNFQHGGHLFEGWNAEEDARLTFGIGTKNKDISWIQTFHAATQEGSDSGAYYCVTKVGSDIDNQGMNFMPSITQSRSLFSLKVGDNLSPNSKHIQKLVETGELVDWEYNKTDMIPYGTMYFDYTKDKVRVYTRTGGWKYLKFEEEV
nr:MAG TPA: hypothetical protein [Caudoviricetes sp.]